MASALPPYVEEDRLAAMSAALLTLGERAASGLGKGELAQVFVEAAQGYVVLMAAGPNAVLVAVTSGSAKVGLVLFEMRKSAARVAEIMEEQEQVVEESEDHSGPDAHADEMPPEPTEDNVEPQEEGHSTPQFGAPVTPPPATESAFSTWH
jgi:uncharacterized protein